MEWLAHMQSLTHELLHDLFGPHWHLEMEVVAEVALAMVLGGLIGLERESANKPAGFRTHMLVAGAAALLVGLGDALLTRFDTETGVPIRADPIRIVEAIVTGISFLGAGTIFRAGSRDTVQGLTTAAALLLSSAIGIAVALRQFALAVSVTLLALLVLRVLKVIERWLLHRRRDGSDGPDAS
ncbi:MAG: MgtC/SapB family protein [Pseudomonadota bacterium]|nr:MgtC/SapB family protein [Pseudomonadota bacterium]